MRKINSIFENMVFFSEKNPNPYWDEMYDKLDSNAFLSANQIIKELSDSQIAEYISVDRESTINQYGEENLISDIVKMKTDDIINLSFNIQRNMKFLNIVKRMIGNTVVPFDKIKDNQR
ncbi:MAG: hypothetical protein ACI4N3_02070 [Alphaproteobacteria bacterium]